MGATIYKAEIMGCHILLLITAEKKYMEFLFEDCS